MKGNKSTHRRAIVSCLLLLLGSAFAQNALLTLRHAAPDAARPWFEAEPVQAIFGATAVNSRSGYEPYVVSMQLGYAYDRSLLSVTAGAHLATGNQQVSLEGIVWPLRFGLLRLGVGTGANWSFDEDLAFELNLMPGNYLEFRPCGWFLFSTHINYLFKGRVIYAIADDVPLLVNHTFAAGVRLQFLLTDRLGIYAGMDSTEFFRYNILFSPTFTLGGTYTAGQFSFLAELNVRYLDFFGIAAYCEGYQFRLLMGVRL